SESVQLLERFAGVFDLTYTRFLDLKQAEAQARESQIQLALERVRSRAMAMQKSGELSELVDTVFKELTKLDFALNWCIINIIDESSLSNTVWAANPDISKAPESYHMKFEDYPFHDAMMEAYKKRATKYIYVLEGAEKKFYDEYLFNETEFRRVPAEAQAASRAMEKYVVSFSFGNFGGLQTVGNEPLSEANLDILERFGKVFDLTYTRFNDLLKAEAQAREAQIEAALERVRSRSMGMQKSEELKEVIQVVYEQFVHLNIKVEHTGFIMDYKERDDMRIWLADKHAVPFQVTIPYFDCAHWNSFNEAKEKGLDFFANHLSFEEKNKFYQDLFKLFPVPDEAKEYYFSCPGLAISTVLLENVGLYIENFSGISYSDEENNTLMRFGKVFQQSYTRFLDLQKAEVQAREAKIEAALERTRTQSMIMQHSKELDDVLRVFHEQVLMLGIHSAFSFLWLPDEKNDRHIFWATWAENVSPAQLVSHNSTVFRSKAINYPLDRNEPATAQCLVDWKGDEPIVSYYVPPAGVENYFAAWQELIDGVEQLKPGHFSGGLYYVEAFMKYGCFGVMVATDLNEEEKKILGRFAVEFERTYTRFLDLQKAEAQAREAKIETALERVRAASLAMHHSNELHSVADVLFQQLRSFGGDIMNAGIALCREDLDEDEFWLSSDDGLRPVISIPHTEDAIQKKLYEDWKNKSEFFSIAKGGDELRAHYNYMSSVPSLKPFFQEGPDWSFPTWQKWHAAYFSHGYVFMITLEPYEEEKILVRFAKVFEQAYTRFLDLQKAEAQAKESQIQLALERIRARTMAMQKSDELAETASLLFKQLLALGVGQKQIRTCAIVTFHTEKPIGECWVTKPNGDIIPQSFMVPYDKMESYKTIYAAWKNGEKFHIVHLAGNALLQHLDNLKEYTDIPVQQFEAVLEKNAESYTHALFFSQGYLYIISSEPLPEYHDIFKRFGSVFEQTYTRFLDLKKAESQAREAHIEAALEKVRSRTMAMQKSNELAETAEVVFQQLISFGIEAHRLYIGIINDESGDLEIWMTDEKGNQVSKRYVVNIHKNISIKKMYEGWEEQQQTLSIDMLGNELHEWIT
ncbi:MAG TPA: hypothetical protein VK588_07660, partial [Chitinophagaceae bacterium]|nr:hypothetical protein [Chitinophagaceae bacterium]